MFNKLIILFAALATFSQVQAGIMLGIGKLPSTSVHAVDESFKVCSIEGECAIFLYRPSAPYGYVLEVVMSERQAANFASNLYGQDMPDPVTFYSTSDEHYQTLLATTPQYGPPVGPPADLPETDKNIGWKLMYCNVLGVAGCLGGSLKAIFKGADNWPSAMAACTGMAKACYEFKEAWDKERAYYKALNDYYRSQGYGPSGKNTGGGGSGSDGQGSTGLGDPGTGEGHMETCVGATIGMGGGPKGEWLEESEVTCYPT
ncbi:MAG TPA: hypothetical protein VE954_14105 [Oligoflexus sp.]|uniref:hypothetical protein n=1 Tax=Oligoflexus sp. TaxID=1971216 RepID=UPI002D45110E|nr:hypothetical protein [Oligoflexus sp.]HYX34233.1 hypothetical protein [Oligoflexus sp.]